MSCIKIKQIHFEPSSHCTAACQLCPRHSYIGDNLYHKKHNLVEQHLDLDIIRRVLSEPQVQGIGDWLLCGNLGEPMMHPDIADLCEMLNGNSAESWMCVHTNGGIGNVETWDRMGRLLRLPRGEMIFSIDGLEDTNHIYRRNTRWDVIMRNAEAFIAAGGRAIWKFIEFDYNRHQIEEARALSVSMGFHAFTVDRNAAHPSQPTAAAEYIMDAPPQSTPALGDFDPESQNREWRMDTTLDCEHCKYSSIFIDAQARVWPCCHLVTVLYNGDPRRKRVAERYLLDPYGLGWNDLKLHTLQEIMDNPYWDDLYASLVDNSGMYMCSRACGKNPFRSRDRQIPL